MMTDSLCIWSKDEDEDNIWDTGCGEIHMFINDGPEDNGYKYCPYCGNDLHHSIATSQEWAE